MPDGDLCTMNLKEEFAPGMGFFLQLQAFRTGIDTGSLKAFHRALLSEQDTEYFANPMSTAACSPVVSQSQVPAELAIPGDVVDTSSQAQQVPEVSASLYASASRFAAVLSNMAQLPVSSQQLPILPLTGIAPSSSLDLPSKKLTVRMQSLQSSRQRSTAQGANPPRVNTRSRLQGIRPLQDEQVNWVTGSSSQGGLISVSSGKPMATSQEPEGVDDAVGQGPSLGEETPTFTDDNGLDMLCAAAALEDGGVNVPVVVEADLQRLSGGILKRERWWEPQGASEPKKRRVTLAPGPLDTTPDGHPERETRTSRAPRPRHEGFTLSQVTKASVRVLEAELGTSEEYLPSINRLKRKVGLLPHLRREFPYRTTPSKPKNPNKATGVQNPGVQKVTRRPVNAQSVSNKVSLLAKLALQLGGGSALDPTPPLEFDCSLPSCSQPVSELTEESAAGSEQPSLAQSSQRLRDSSGANGVTDSCNAGNVTGHFPTPAGPTRLVSHVSAPASLLQT